jgi:hypothetical protein
MDKMNDTQMKEWLEFVQASSIPLRCLDASNLPLLGAASGCMIDYHGKRFLLSVFHAMSRPGKWAMELRFDIDRNLTELYFPGAFNFLVEMTLSMPGVTDVDFAYVELPGGIESTFQHLTFRGECLASRQRPVFSPTFDVAPNKQEMYAFSGQIKPAFISGLNALETEHQTYPGLSYERTENGHLYFRLPRPHPGHEFFEGCSGAPIIDSRKNLIALVCGGDAQKDEIYGVDLAKYKVALDIACSDFLK